MHVHLREGWPPPLALFSPRVASTGLKGKHLRSFSEFKFQIYVCLHGPFPSICAPCFLFIQAVSFFSSCAGIINHAELLKRGRKLSMQEQNRKPGNQKGKTQIVRHLVSKRWARWCLRVWTFCSTRSRGRCCSSWAWGEVDFFLSPACADSAFERNGETMRHRKRSCPGLGLGWPRTFSPSTDDRVMKRVYYLLHGGTSSKVIKYSLGDLLSSWQKRLGQAPFIDMRVRSCPGQHPLQAGSPNSLHRSSRPELQNLVPEACSAPDEQDPAKL